MLARTCQYADKLCYVIDGIYRKSLNDFVFGDLSKISAVCCDFSNMEAFFTGDVVLSSPLGDTVAGVPGCERVY